MQYILCLVLLLLQACGSGSRETLRVGVDPNWYPLDFGPQVSYINGFTEDLLLELARYSGIEFEKVNMSWDNLNSGLRAKKYDAILTSLEPYEYNQAKYDFSEPFLALGPVLIVHKTSVKENLSELKGDFLGIITNSGAALVLEKYPELIIRTFSSIPDLLNAVATRSIQGALLENIPALNFVTDLYADQLKIVGEPLTNAGLRLVALKRANHTVAAFKKGLVSFKKRKEFDHLLAKWGLQSK